MGSLNREWDTEINRDKFLKNLKVLRDSDTFFNVMQKIENGFNDPWQVSIKRLEDTTEEEKSRRPENSEVQ